MTTATLTALLRAAGLAPARVVRNRHTGVFTLRFDCEDATNFRSRGTDPARVWASRIAAVLPGVEVVDTYDAIASHRPVHPVIQALVFVRVSEAKAA